MIVHPTEPPDGGYHPNVAHPADLMPVARSLNQWVGEHLAVLFGSMWTVWVFLTYPLLGLLLPSGVQQIVFFISSGWIQLWALPLLNYTANSADAARQAKADADHAALTHIALEIDAIKTKLGVTEEPE